MSDYKPRASEGGHWYDRDGTPCYDVPTADGKGTRAATLRDARKFGWYPGVTSIIRCAAAPGLERWKLDQAILSSLTLPRVPGESNDALIARIKADADEQAKKARERGTEIHAAVQGHFKGTPPSEEMWPFVAGVIETIKANFGEQEWKTEHSVAHALGFGTKADLHARAGNLILDFKGAEFTKEEAPKLKTWDEHHMQLGATREALVMPGARCAIAYISRNVPGLCRIIEVDEEDLQSGWDQFRGLLNYWQANRRYWPALWTAKEAA